MSALFERGFFVREPAWHGEGVVLGDYPGREEAMRLAGHDWDVIEIPLQGLYTNEQLTRAGRMANPDGKGYARPVECSVLHVRSDNLFELATHSRSFERIQNSTAYDVAELLFDQGFQYDAGVTLDGGKACALTLLLDEPISITGDDSVVLPYGVLRWAHDGSASLSVQSGAIRVVCMNTWQASESEARKLGTSFTFRHTKNVAERIDDAKQAIKGVRAGLDVYREVAEELAAIEVTPAQRDWFVSTIVGDRDGQISLAPVDLKVTQRVKDNVETERAKINAAFFGATVPEAHKLTGYGLFLAGGEYFDHLRNFRSQDSYVRRTLLTAQAEKQNLRKTIDEALVAA